MIVLQVVQRDRDFRDRALGSLSLGYHHVQLFNDVPKPSFTLGWASEPNRLCFIFGVRHPHQGVTEDSKGVFVETSLSCIITLQVCIREFRDLGQAIRHWIILDCLFQTH